MLFTEGEECPFSIALNQEPSVPRPSVIAGMRSCFCSHQAFDDANVGAYNTKKEWRLRSWRNFGMRHCKLNTHCKHHKHGGQSYPSVLHSFLLFGCKICIMHIQAEMSGFLGDERCQKEEGSKERRTFTNNYEFWQWLECGFVVIANKERYEFLTTCNVLIRFMEYLSEISCSGGNLKNASFFILVHISTNAHTTSQCVKLP